MDYLAKKTIEDINVKDKKVLVRCDFNVPLKDGAITNDKRIVAAIPTIEYLVREGARVILCSHLGRPKNGPEPQFSLAPVAARLSELLGKPVIISADVVGADAKAKAEALKSGDVMLIENVRFEKGETKNDPDLAKQYASLADMFVNDAFGTAHRAHASTAGVAEFLPAVCGYLIQKELRFIGGTLQDPKRPLVAILGGAKVSDKIGVITNLLEKVDTLIIGGGMAYTFHKAMGDGIGQSLCEDDWVERSKQMVNDAEVKGVNLLLPTDHRIGDKYDESTKAIITDTPAVPDDMMGMDIGPKSEELFAAEIKNAGTVLWNGPMGVFEFDEFALGTCAVAKAIAESDAVSVIGGGDSVAAVTKLGYADKMSHISTGGGATLEFMEGLELPGIACLDDK